MKITTLLCVHFICVQLYGRRCEEAEGVLEHISYLCSFMEDCLKDWWQHVGDQRTKLYYLNHFTTEQLVILQAELAKVGNDQKNGLSRHVYPLLSKVKRNCCLKDLQKAMHLAFTEVTDECDHESTLTVAAEAEEMNGDVVDASHDVEVADVQEFVKKMEESYFSKKLALRAIREVGSKNVDEGNTQVQIIYFEMLLYFSISQIMYWLNETVCYFKQYNYGVRTVLLNWE